jgi:hypothetical protein
MITNTNAWNSIPLEDYERHMQHETVAQAQLLNHLTRVYLEKYNPESLVFLGISGGNGLEHINTEHTKSVYGIDINNSYLQETQKRFGDKIRQLTLVNLDISASNNFYIQADFIWAALIFEYIDIEKGFQFIVANSGDSTKLIVTVQSNNGNQSVSQTSVESIKAVKDIFRIVDKNELESTALRYQFKLIAEEENVLPNGKSFFTYEFKRAIIW